MNSFPILHQLFPLEKHEDWIIAHIISSIKSSLSGKIGKINENSEELFYNYIKTSDIDRSSFSYNWPYVVQATRNNGFYYHTDLAIIYFYLRKNANVSPYPYNLVVINHLGQYSEQSVYELAEAAQKLCIGSVVKNVDLEKIALWRDLNFHETEKPWSHYSFRDDNSFPEFVYDIKKYVTLKFNRTTRASIKKFLNEKNYIFLPYNDSFKNDGLQLLQENAEYLENKGVDFKHEVFLAHRFVFDDSIKNKVVFAILEENHLIGMSFLTHFQENLFFNAIINQNKPNLMRFLLWKSVAHYCATLEEDKKPLYLALQGSENEGQNRWKSFFHPIRSIYRTHVTNMLNH